MNAPLTPPPRATEALLVEAIRLAFRALFRRDTDASLTDRYVAHARQTDAGTALRKYFADAVASAEFRERYHPQPDWQRRVLQVAPGLPDQTAIHHVVSVGSLCFPSTQLKVLGWKRFSGPFDWIFSTPEMVADCIATDFAEFLLAEQMRPDAAGARRCRHAAFQAAYRIGAPIFNHHNPLDPVDRAYLQRCVERFRRLLRSPDRTLLVAFRPAEPDPVPFVRLRDVLRRRAANTHLLYVDAQVSPDGLSHGVRCLSHGADASHWSMQTVSPLHYGTSFRSELDNLQFRLLLSGFPLALRPDISG